MLRLILILSDWDYNDQKPLLNLRILHVVPTYLPATRYGGPIYSVHNLCKALVQCNHEVYVYTTNINGQIVSDVPLAQCIDIDGVQVAYFGSTHLRRLYFSPGMKQALLQNMKTFDVAHLHSIFLWPTLISARVAETYRVNYVISPRGMLVKDLIDRKSRWIKKFWLRLFDKKNIEHASLLHVTSDLEAREAQRFRYKLPLVRVIPNGVDPIVDSESYVGIATCLSAKISFPFILFLGRINWKKGLDKLVPAMKYCPGGVLVIAGNDEDDYRRELQVLAEGHEVGPNVIFLGRVEGSEKAWLLRNASILVLPSYSENFGNVVLEAMSVGCPVIVTSKVGLAEVVSESQAGVVCDGDPEELGDTMDYLLQNPEVRATMGGHGRQVARERFSWQTVAQKMEAAYQDIAQIKKLDRA